MTKFDEKAFYNKCQELIKTGKPYKLKNGKSEFRLVLNKEFNSLAIEISKNNLVKYNTALFCWDKDMKKSNWPCFFVKNESNALKEAVKVLIQNFKDLI